MTQSEWDDIICLISWGAFVGMLVGYLWGVQI